VLTQFTTFLNASIGRRLALGMTTTLLAGLAIAMTFLIRSERHAIQDILEVKGRTALNMTRRRIEQSFARDHVEPMTEELDALLQDRDFNYAFVYDDQGHVLVNLNDPDVPPGPRAELPPLADQTGQFTVHVAEGYLEIVTPVVVNGQRVAGLGLGVSLDLQARQVAYLRARFLLVTAGLITSALAFIFLWTRSTLAPLLQLKRGAEQLTQGDLSVRVPVQRMDEVGTLASTFNNLAQSLQQTLHEKDRALQETNRLYRNLKVARARLGRAERLSAVGMLAAGVSHELNNPLGIILSTAGNVREALGDHHPISEDVAIIEAESQRCRRIIQGLLNFASSGESHPVEVDLNQLLRDTFALAARDERAQHVNADWKLDAHLPLLWVDPHQLQQVFLNLLLNAADAMNRQGVISVRTAESIEGGRRAALIEFTDHGCGIAAADLDHIFDPFYTTKKGGAGFGLGLAVSYGIIAAHGGEITVASEVGRGSVFTITLPVRPESTRAESAGQMR